MIKKGFTLAEVLITLGIVGTIAAITLPTLMSGTATAQVGPKLAKAVSMFEQANESLLSANAVDSLDDTGFLDSDDAGVLPYFDELADYLKVSRFNGRVYTAVGNASEFGDDIGTFNQTTTLLSKDGMFYHIELHGDINTGVPVHRQRIGTVHIDINGNTAPNEYATDIFAFAWYNDGALRPVGGADWASGSGGEGWLTGCNIGTTPTHPETCAGHIFENNLKILYR